MQLTIMGRKEKIMINTENVITILVMVAIYGLAKLIVPATRAISSKEREEMSKEMIGKNQKECREVLRKHK